MQFLTPIGLTRNEKTKGPSCGLAPGDGYALVVDGHFKTHFAEKAAAEKAATELLAKYPMLQIEIYDASSRSRTLVK